MECKSLRESGEELSKFDIAYFGASCDPAEKNKQFYDDLDLNFPLLSDSDGTVAAAYGILSSSGKRSKRTTIYVDMDGKIAHIQSKVNIRDHGKQVVDQIKKLKFPMKK